MAAPATLSCPKCRAGLIPEPGRPGTPQPCPACARPVEGLIFPAFHRPPAAGRNAEAVIAAEDAGCFYHPENRAQTPCDVCGRFLCALCDVDLQGQHVCPACVNAGPKKNQIRNLDGDRLLWGGTASMIALLPLLLFWPATIITGPLAVFVALYGWKKPQSLTGAGRASYIIAIIFGLLETLGWLLLFAGIFKFLR